VKGSEPHEPFALIVWENAAYLVDDERRSRVFTRLKRQVGVDPIKLLAAGARRIQAAISEDGGMRPPHRASKVYRCAELAIEFAGGDLLAQLRASPPASQKRLLKRFPGIGNPGADKILLLCGLGGAPALDSNGLRVLERLGFIDDAGSYDATYRAGVAYLRAHGVCDAASSIDAFELLRAHGRELCKRTNRQCAQCPLRRQCPSSLSR